ARAAGGRGRPGRRRVALPRDGVPQHCVSRAAPRARRPHEPHERAGTRARRRAVRSRPVAARGRRGPERACARRARGSPRPRARVHPPARRARRRPRSPRRRDLARERAVADAVPARPASRPPRRGPDTRGARSLHGGRPGRRRDRPTTPLPPHPDVDAQEVIVLAALGGHVDAVVDAVGPGFRGVVGGSPEGTLVEHAAWVGDAALVGRLLALGAEPGSALGWAAHGSRNHTAPGRDYVAVAELLVAADAPLEAGLLDDAEGPLYAWLRAQAG